MNNESANKFIAALVKSLQTLCHGYVEFDDGIEIIGHLYLNIDSGSTFDYVVKEKVCKNQDNATVFVSKSFHAEGKPENTLLVGDKDVLDSKLAAHLDNQGMSPQGTTRIQSAISNISNVLSGTQAHHPSHSPQNTGKRKREHNGNYSQPPYKYTNLQTSSSSSSAMPYFSNNPTVKHHPSHRDNLKHYNHPQSEFFGGDSNQSSGMGPDDEEDLNLDVTFVKEEYAERNARNAAAAAAAARAHHDPSNNQGGNMLPENNGGEGGGSYPLGYHPNAQNQPFVGGGGGDLPNINQSFQDPSQVDVGHHIPPPPNPRIPDPAVDGSSGGGGGDSPLHKMWSQHYSTVSPPTTSAPTTSSSAGPVITEVSKPVRTHSCPVCGLQISHRKNVRRHMRKHTGEMFFCELCDWKGTCRWKMQKHRERKHGIPILSP